jgi:3-hydroxyisobutyrate dehydrogenase-like beta-hydroxyacid dehydrogenase
MLHWAQIAAIAESLELGRRHGLSVPLLRAALLDSPVASRTLAELDQMRLTWHAKDLDNALVAGRAVGQDLPIARQSQQQMRGITVDSLRDLLCTGGVHTPDIYYEKVKGSTNG